MSDSSKSKAEWTNHLAKCMPAIMTSSKALQILVGTSNAVPFDPPLAFPFPRPKDGKSNVEKEKKYYVRFVRRAGGSWQVEKGEKKPSAERINHSKDVADATSRQEGDLRNGDDAYFAANNAPRKEILLRQKMMKPRQNADNAETDIRRNVLRKLAALKAGSLMDNDQNYMRNIRSLRTDQLASCLGTSALGPPLDIRPNFLTWKIPCIDGLRSRAHFPWKVSGIGQTMLSWQEHLVHLPKGKGRSPPTNQVPVTDIFFLKTRPHIPEILLCVSESMRSSIHTNINFVRIPRSYKNACRDTSSFLEGQTTDSWIFIYMADLARVGQSHNRMLAPADLINIKEASWTVIAFPTGAISRSFETRTVDGHMVTRYELCKSGRWPLVDGEHVNVSGWHSWVDAVAVGAGAIEFRV